MNHKKLLLIDFDCSLTKTHTTGALCFANNHFDHHLPAEFDRYDERVFSSNNACLDAKFIIETLLELIDNNICVSIVTMSDSLHENTRIRQLCTDKQTQEYKVLAGKALVVRWLYCVAARAYNFDQDAAELILERLFTSNRFYIAAKFNPTSKKDHYLESVSYFQQMGTLTLDLRPNEIGYADDTMEFLADLEKQFPGVGIFWISQGGMTKKVWHEIAIEFNIPFLAEKTKNYSETKSCICRTLSVQTISATNLTV